MHVCVREYKCKPFEFVVHFLDLLLHISNFEFARLNLFFELFDLVVEHKLEFFKLLVLLFQIVNALQKKKPLLNTVQNARRCDLLYGCANSVVWVCEFYLLLVANGLVALADLFFEAVNFLFEHGDVGV